MSVQTREEGAVGWIVLDRPESLNAITVELGLELERALRSFGPEVTAIAIRGAGGNFCAGGDFAEVERLRAGGPEALRPLFENFGSACRAISELEVPVVSVVEGVAAAGGFELMLASDVVLVRADARIADNHIRFGQVPGGGSTQRLPRLLGRQLGLSLLLSGDRLSGADAHRLGLALSCWEPEEFEDGVAAFLTTLAGRRRDAVVGIKRLVYDGLAGPLADGLALEREAVIAHIAGEAGGVGVDAFSSRSSS